MSTPSFASTSSSSSMIDEETRQIIIKKTWCHGQLVAPIYSLVLIWWYFASNDDDDDDDDTDDDNDDANKVSKWILWIPICYFPLWCYLSYKNIFGTIVDLSISKEIIWGGLMTEICHIIVLIQSLSNIQNTMNLLLCISSILFLIETAAFLLVVFTLRPRNNNNETEGQQQYSTTGSTASSGGGNYQYHDTIL